MKKLLAKSLAIALAVTAFPVTASATEATVDVTVESKTNEAEQVQNSDEAQADEKSIDATSEEVKASEETQASEEEKASNEASTSEEEASEVTKDIEDDGYSSFTATKVEIAGEDYYYILKTDDITSESMIIINEDEEKTEVAFNEFIEVDSTDVYYYTDADLSGNLYGYASASYTELYKGQTSAESYDAVSSATTRKSALFTSTNVSEVTDDGYSIYGLNSANIAVSKETYVKAALLNEASALSDEAYKNVLAVDLNEDPTAAPSYYLPYDGNDYSSAVIRKRRVVHDATGELKYNTRYGTFQLEIDEASTSYLRRTRDNDIYPINNSVHGAILRGTDANGNSIALGVRHLKELWVSTYEIAFNPDTNAAASFEGGTITSVDYLTASDVYTFKFETPVQVKNTYKNENLEAYFNKNNTNELVIKGFDTTLNNATLSLSYRQGHSSVAVVDKVPVSVDNGCIKYVVSEELIPETSYTVTIVNDDYADIVLTVTPETLGGEDETAEDSETPVTPEAPDEPSENPVTPETPSEATDDTMPEASEDSNDSKENPVDSAEEFYKEVDRQLNEVVVPQIVKCFGLPQTCVSKIMEQLYCIQRQLIGFFFGR